MPVTQWKITDFNFSKFGSEAAKAIKAKVQQEYKWLGGWEERKTLMKAAIALRKHMQVNGVQNVVFIETSGRPLAMLFSEMDRRILAGKAGKEPITPIRMLVEELVSRTYPVMNSQSDKSKMVSRTLVPTGTERDKKLGSIRDPNRLHIYNLSTPDAFDYPQFMYGSKTTVEWIKLGWMPEYAIFRERATALFTLIACTDKKIMFVDDFIETGDTMRELRDFLKKMKWVHQQIGKDWVDDKQDPELYHKAHGLFQEASKHLDEVKLNNVYFASLYGHTNFEMPKGVFIAQRSLFPPSWHPSNVYDGKHIDYSLEAVVQRHGYPWGTPISEVGSRNEYVTKGTSCNGLRVHGAPYAPFEVPFMQSRRTNLELAISYSCHHWVSNLIGHENSKRRVEGRGPMDLDATLLFMHKLARDEAFAREAVIRLYPLSGEPNEDYLKDNLYAIREFDPAALKQKYKKIETRPRDLQTEIRRLVKDWGPAIRDELS